MMEAGPLQFMTREDVNAQFRAQDVRDAFYHTFRELTDQRGLPASPGIFGSERILLRARQVLEDVLLPELNKKEPRQEKVTTTEKTTRSAEQVANIPGSTIVLAVYAAAAQQATRLTGRTTRAREMFRAMQNSRFETIGLRAMGATDTSPGLLDRPETIAYVKQVRADLTQTLTRMG